MDFALGVLLGAGLAVIVAAAWRAIRAPRVAGIPQSAMQAALHAATSTLPYLRGGLTPRTAEQAVPYLQALTGAAAIAAGAMPTQASPAARPAVWRQRSRRAHQPWVAASSPGRPSPTSAVPALLGCCPGAVMAIINHALSP